MSVIAEYYHDLMYNRAGKPTPSPELSTQFSNSRIFHRSSNERLVPGVEPNAPTGDRRVLRVLQHVSGTQDNARQKAVPAQEHDDSLQLHPSGSQHLPGARGTDGRLGHGLQLQVSTRGLLEQSPSLEGKS